MRFEEFVAARGHALLQLATLLSRDPVDAQPLLDDALADLVGHFGRAERGEGPEAYAQRALVRLAAPRRRPSHEHEPERVHDTSDAVRHFLHELPPRARAVLVLRLWLDLDDTQIADLLDVTPASVHSTADKHLARLRAVLPDHDVEAEVRHVLLADAAGVPAPSQHLPVAATRLARRRRRIRIAAAAAGAAVAVAAGAAGVPWLVDVAQGPRPDVDASLAAPMRLRDCPGGRLHSATEPHLPPSLPRPRTVDELLAQGWEVTARPRYPDARPHLAVRTTSTRSYVYLTPDGRRVGVVHLAFVEAGWRFMHLEYC